MFVGHTPTTLPITPDQIFHLLSEFNIPNPYMEWTWSIRTYLVFCYAGYRQIHRTQFTEVQHLGNLSELGFDDLRRRLIAHRGIENVHPSAMEQDPIPAEPLLPAAVIDEDKKDVETFMRSSRTPRPRRKTTNPRRAQTFPGLTPTPSGPIRMKLPGQNVLIPQFQDVYQDFELERQQIVLQSSEEE